MFNLQSSAIIVLGALSSRLVLAQNGPLDNKGVVCENILDTCPFSSIPDCVSNFCDGTPYGWGSCAEVIPGPAGACCSDPNPQSCFSALQANSDPGAPPTITGSPATETNPCSILASIQLECISSSSDKFLNAPVTVQAQCLCYGLSGNYNPDQWDGPASACLAQGPGEDPAIFSELAADDDQGLAFCTDFAGPNPVPSLTSSANIGPGPTSNNGLPRQTGINAGEKLNVPVLALFAIGLMGFVRI